MVSGLSTAEQWHFYWCRFKIGQTLTFSSGASATFNVMRTAGKGLKTAGFSDFGTYLIDSADNLDKEYNQGTPSPCVTKKTWWDKY